MNDFIIHIGVLRKKNINSELIFISKSDKHIEFVEKFRIYFSCTAAGLKITQPSGEKDG